MFSCVLARLLAFPVSPRPCFNDVFSFVLDFLTSINIDRMGSMTEAEPRGGENANAAAPGCSPRAPPVRLCEFLFDIRSSERTFFGQFCPPISKMLILIYDPMVATKRTSVKSDMHIQLQISHRIGAGFETTLLPVLSLSAVIGT